MGQARGIFRRGILTIFLIFTAPRFFASLENDTARVLCSRLLVYFESCRDAKRAIEREKELKGFLRIEKENLIKLSNPNWDDLGLMLFPELYLMNEEKK